MLSSHLPVNEMQPASQISTVSLGDHEVMPADVIKKIVSYLDVGHIVSLSQVNQFLRELLVGWSALGAIQKFVSPFEIPTLDGANPWLNSRG
jgi:hypothetical protein